MRVQKALTFEMARIAIGSEREESLRLIGLGGPQYGTGMCRVSREGDLKRLYDWHREVLSPGLFSEAQVREDARQVLEDTKLEREAPGDDT